MSFVWDSTRVWPPSPDIIYHTVGHNFSDIFNEYPKFAFSIYIKWVMPEINFLQ